MDRRVQRPIFLIGAGRSGTSLVARIFSRHPDVAYLPEPRPIWMHGNAYRRHDALTEADLTPRIARYIDHKFARFLEASGRSCLVEKTPSNCLRLRFIVALYPDSKIINVIRDGRAVVRSTLQIRARPARRGSLAGRLRITPWWEWPAYIPQFFDTWWRTNVLHRPARYWGARPPGWQAWKNLPPHLVVANQWRALVEASLRDGRPLGPDRYLEVRYEHLISDPIHCIGKMIEFAGLRQHHAPFAFARERIDPSRQARWHGTLTREQEQEVEDVLAPMLRELGYIRSSDRSS